MNRTNKFFSRGLWIFAFQVVCIIAAISVGLHSLILISIVVSITLSLGLLILLLQASKALDESIQETFRLKQRENAHLNQEQQAANENWQQVETFRADEALARVMPAAGTNFNNIAAYTEKLLQNIAKELNIVQGLFFVLNNEDKMFHATGEYAYFSEEQPRNFPMGETLSGQVAKNKKLLNLKELPDGYITILSGLGKSSPRQLVIAPVVHNDECIGVMELASFKPFGENEELLVQKVCETMANMLNELRNQV